MDFATPLEMKVAAGAAQDDVLIAFEAFKDANDERLAQIEKRMSADVVTAEKVDRISRAIDELTLKARRPLLAARPRPSLPNTSAPLMAMCARAKRRACSTSNRSPCRSLPIRWRLSRAVGNRSRNRRGFSPGPRPCA
jgi:predicted phage gp36 major capsid-like protein